MTRRQDQLDVLPRNAAAQMAVEKLPSLEELAQEFQEFVDSVESQEAQESHEETSQALVPHLEGLPAQRDKLAWFIFECEARASALLEKAGMITAKAKRIRRLAEEAKFGLKIFMQMKGIRKIEGAESTFTLKKNPPSVTIIDAAAIPGEYIKYEPVPDKAKILEALKDGKEVPGATLIMDNARVEVK